MSWLKASGVVKVVTVALNLEEAFAR